MNFPVFDLHCDTADVLSGAYNMPCEPLRRNNAHIDLERGKQFSAYAQCFACFTTYSEDVNPADTFERKLAAIHREISKNEDLIAQAFSAQDIEYNAANGIISAILTIEGPVGFGCDPELLSDLQKIGFRISSLSWNEKNPLTGSHVTGGGLTDLGREYVRECQRLGIAVDVSHISDEGFWDIINITDAPIVATHSNSRSVYPVSRNLTDDMFRAICQTGGVAGINLYADFIGGSRTLDAVCDHIIHFLELDPDGTHISLGGDLDGCDCLPAEFAGVQDYPRLAQALLVRGVDQKTVKNIFWDNAMGVFKRCCM
jgi:membrane dipeptidase